MFRSNRFRRAPLVLALAAFAGLSGCAHDALREAPRATPTTSAIGSAVSGTYPNLFVEAGYAPDAVQARIDATFQQLFHGDPATQSVYYPAGANANGPLAYIHDVHNNDVRSEGLSYGMMIAVQLGKKQEFDAIWNWARSYAYHADIAHPAHGFFAWSLKPDGSQLDEMPAPDGEQYFVTALYFAAARWGNGTGIYDYRAEADRILADMLHRAPVTGPTKRGAMTAGNLFDADAKLVRFTPDIANRNHTDASYQLPAFYEVWAKVGPVADRAFWAQAAQASRDYFHAAANPRTALTSDYGNFDGTPWAAPWNPGAADFRYDARRSAMNWSVDWSWWRRDPREVELSDHLQAFFVAQGLRDYASLYTLDGKPLGGEHSTGLVAMNATASLAADDARRLDFVRELWKQPVPEGEYRYYDGMLYLLALLHCSGEFKAWLPAQP